MKKCFLGKRWFVLIQEELGLRSFTVTTRWVSQYGRSYSLSILVVIQLSNLQ